jgi:hypothetical protein
MYRKKEYVRESYIKRQIKYLPMHIVQSLKFAVAYSGDYVLKTFNKYIKP